MSKRSIKTAIMSAGIGSAVLFGAFCAPSAFAADTDTRPAPSPSASQPASHPGESFKDSHTSIFSGDIDWMKQQGLSTGYSDGTYRPNEVVTRQAMAAFLYRLAGSPDFTAPATSPFSDVPTTSQFYKEITWLNATGISTGYSDGTFRPEQPVARDAMAAFMFRYAANVCHVTAASQWTTDNSGFDDVTKGTQFFREIAWMKHTGVSTGYSDKTFRNLHPVTREAMAAFVHRLNNFIEANGGCSTGTPSPAPTETATPSPTDSATATPTESASPEPTDTSSAAPTESATPAPTDTATSTPTETATAAPTDTATATPTDSASATPMP